MAFQSIAKEDLSKVIQHVQDKDKKALVAALEASQDDACSGIAQSLRASMSSQSPATASDSKRPSKVAPQDVSRKTAGGFGIKHVIVALTLSAIGGLKG
jgi:hypothetical protein